MKVTKSLQEVWDWKEKVYEETKGLSIVLILALGVIFGFCVSSCFAEESITITTYYPSPYGSYNELRAKRMSIGDNYYDGGSYHWGVEIDNNADLVVEGNVGIGAPIPGAKLDVAGNIKIADGTQSAGYVLTSDANGLASWTVAPGGGGNTRNV